MKALSLLLPFALLTASVARAQPSSPAEFIAAYRDALQEKSVQKLDALTYQVGMSEAGQKQVDSLLMEFNSNKAEVAEISLKPLPDDFHPVNIGAGKKWELTYPPAGFITVDYKRTPNGPLSFSAPYAVIGGHYYLVSVKSTDLGWKGPPDRTLGLNALSFSPNEDLRITVRWNVSGVDQEKIFKTSSVIIMGQYFEQVTVTRLTDGKDLTLTLTEGGKEIFHSQPLKGKGSIEYKKS